MSTPTSAAVLTAQRVLDLPNSCLSRGEAGFVEALSNLAALSKSKEQRTVMTAIADTLLAGSGHTRSPADQDLWFYLHGSGQNCPDLTLVSEASNRVVAVIEAKLNAHAAATAWSTFNAAQPFAKDPLKHLRRQLKPRTAAAHPWSPTCGCSWHTTPDKTGLVTPAVAQIDSYRLTRTWVDNTPDIVLDDPTQAAWIVLDRSARPISALFKGALTITEWHPANIADLAATVSRLHATCREAESRQALRAVAFHLLN
ncbi:hypothetical protein E9549_20865 [Blastococcus sp. MG754426]|uniref:hypothetical protein n=1 Tax=unclassified Blastococcus TaxID=2619396 RepID=UPI001EEFD218|nr:MULTISPECIES: hypothetical protein [unclassified Blastococcus]MCF6509821.1 hypothetical protein [Blastococcus sp. MG754426]MCF6514207.1 hypothetical protein [Blastococcus sp. MG754427]